MRYAIIPWFNDWGSNMARYDGQPRDASDSEREIEDQERVPSRVGYKTDHDPIVQSTLTWTNEAPTALEMANAAMLYLMQPPDSRKNGEIERSMTAGDLIQLIDGGGDTWWFEASPDGCFELVEEDCPSFDGMMLRPVDAGAVPVLS